MLGALLERFGGWGEPVYNSFCQYGEFQGFPPRVACLSHLFLPEGQSDKV